MWQDSERLTMHEKFGRKIWKKI